MLKYLLFTAQVSGADRLAGAQKYMGRSLTIDDYAVIFSVVLIMVGFAIIVAIVYKNQKNRKKD